MVRENVIRRRIAHVGRATRYSTGWTECRRILQSRLVVSTIGKIETSQMCVAETSRPSALPDLLRWAPRVFSFHHLSSVFLQFERLAGNKFATTSDSKFCRDFFPDPSQNPRPFHRRHQQHRCLLSLDKILSDYLFGNVKRLWFIHRLFSLLIDH